MVQPPRPLDIVGVIPARGGSKGIPRKNIRPLLGKPLLVWTVEAARASGALADVLVSTDDEEIAAVARQAGARAPFLRPSELARDETPTAAVVRHALEWLAEREGRRPAWVMVLEPTAPARQPFHIREAARLLEDGGAESIASVSEVPHHFAPSKILARASDGTVTGFDGTPIRRMAHRRQELPVSYALNGLIFACRAELPRCDPPTLWGERVLGYVVEPLYALDLDRPEEWVMAEARMKLVLEQEQSPSCLTTSR
jgi:CMP-N-acetylneuraminic acid synthetase